MWHSSHDMVVSNFCFMVFLFLSLFLHEAILACQQIESSRLVSVFFLRTHIGSIGSRSELSGQPRTGPKTPELHQYLNCVSTKAVDFPCLSCWIQGSHKVGVTAEYPATWKSPLPPTTLATPLCSYLATPLRGYASLRISR